jgi:4-alpha-glucanotransferase
VSRESGQPVPEGPFDRRTSGVLLHPTSLPGPYGTGDLGPAAHRFAHFLARARQGFWQMLPVGPTGAGASPYSSPSSFAGSALLVSLEELAQAGLLTKHEIEAPRALGTARRALYPQAIAFREARLRLAFERFERKGGKKERLELEVFRALSRRWLRDYALFSALWHAHGGRPWNTWQPALRDRRPAELRRAARELAPEIRYHEFVQFAFARQWKVLRELCSELGVKLLGDVPMFVAPDSVELWQSPANFQLDARGRPKRVAGVPPDGFNPDGQLWGNPLYDWGTLDQTRYAFWVDRLGAALDRFDAVRLDHFIGLYRSWSVRPGARSAKSGRFERVPGDRVLERLRQILGGLPFVAEDLGMVTPEVRELRDRFGLPGMRVLVFGFDPGASEHLPHNYPENSVVCTGTHDTNTLIGWYRGLDRDTRRRVDSYVGGSRGDRHWQLVRTVMASAARVALFPIQDLLGLGAGARMNRPGTATGNWDYRVEASALSSRLADRLAEVTVTYERT